MVLSVPDRIQIMPVGYEVKRVTEAAEKFKPDKVILITHSENDNLASECLSNIAQEFDNKGVDYEVRDCNLFDLHASLGEIAAAIYEHGEDNVYVNTSTGSKITAIAGMIASMVTGSTPYYVRATNYDGPPSEIESYDELPRYPIDHPEFDQIATMEYIKRMAAVEHDPSKGELIQFAEANELRYVDQNVAGKGKYRLLDSHVIDPLESEGYIEVIKEGRKSLVTLTESGRNAIQAYRYLIPNLNSLNWDPSQRIEQTSSAESN